MWNIWLCPVEVGQKSHLRVNNISETLTCERRCIQVQWKITWFYAVSFCASSHNGSFTFWIETKDWDQSFIWRRKFSLSPKLRLTNFTEQKLVNYSLFTCWHRCSFVCLFVYFWITKKWSDFHSVKLNL